MSKETLENIRILVGINNRQVRSTFTNTLCRHGYVETIDTDLYEVVYESVENDSIDVLVCDSVIGGVNVADLLNQIRHNEVGRNPFLVVIIISDEFSAMAIQKFITSGADDILLSPLSVGHLIKRIDALKEDRQMFVVTSEYIGPDRRKGNRIEGEDIPKIAVPNMLKYKALGGTNHASMQIAIDATSQVINQQKMDRQAIQINYLVDQIMPLYSTDSISNEVVPLIIRLEKTAEDLTRRMRGTDKEHISELGRSVHQVAKSINKSPMKPKAKDIQLLPELGIAIKKAFAADTDDIQMAKDISQSIINRSL